MVPGGYGHGRLPLLDSLSIWDKRLLPSRRAIYRMIAFAMDHKEPIYRAVLVTIFEATGKVFFRHTRLLMQRLGLDQQLGYFGTGHYEAEVSHSVKMDELAELVVSPASVRSPAAWCGRPSPSIAGCSMLDDVGPGPWLRDGAVRREPRAGARAIVARESRI